MATESYFEKLAAHEPIPDFSNLLAVLERGRPSRPTLFEFFLNGRLYQRLSGMEAQPGEDSMAGAERLAKAFCQAGYDYVTYQPPGFHFPRAPRAHERTISLNDGIVISDRKSFDECPWINPRDCDYSNLDKIGRILPDGMKVITPGPGGVLENAIALAGYQALCLMIVDDPVLAKAVFDAVGSRLVQHYEIAGQYDAVGACISNDDWGFKTQPMLPPAMLREYVFPWHRKIVETIHAHGRPAILHSCGNPSEILDDVIDDMKFDGRHSFEDAIQPVEEAYTECHQRIALLGGIDVDFVCRHTPDQVYARSKRMLEIAAGDGSYALGTGNSVPDYVPDENYCAMAWAAVETRT